MATKLLTQITDKNQAVPFWEACTNWAGAQIITLRNIRQIKRTRDQPTYQSWAGALHTFYVVVGVRAEGEVGVADCDNEVVDGGVFGVTRRATDTWGGRWVSGWSGGWEGCTRGGCQISRRPYARWRASHKRHPMSGSGRTETATATLGALWPTRHPPISNAVFRHAHCNALAKSAILTAVAVQTDHNTLTIP